MLNEKPGEKHSQRMKIYVSGLYSGTNPQPGIGIARSLRAAYPSAELVGVEYSARSSGIHWPDYDEVWLQRPWEELDLDTYAARIREFLDGGALWLPGTDLEIIWLSSIFPEGHRNLLAPMRRALDSIGKPAVPAHEGLPVRVPDYIHTEEHPDWDLHAFCRRHDWKVWLKGPYYEAVKVNGWGVVEAVRAALSRAWSTQRIFLQKHVTGYEQSVCFCAYRGELLSCVHMRKRELTEEGKTWAGDVTDVSPEFIEPLRKIVAALNWTGGAEIEMVGDTQGQLWLIEWNPRFPAWIHGSTIAGRNLPALLVQAATGVPFDETPVISEEFTRVVLELPVRPTFPLPQLPEPLGGGYGHSLKHPSGALALAERLHKASVLEQRESSARAIGADSRATQAQELERVPATFLKDVGAHDFSKIETPSWLFLESTANDLFRLARELSVRLSTPQVKVSNGYSIKTNPDERLIKNALHAGFYAEGISLLEVQKALRVGFKPAQCILNGPGKWWPPGLLPKSQLHAVFADSIADLKRIIGALESGDLQSQIVGVRLRTPNFVSRFGIPVDSPEALRTLTATIQKLPRECAFGIHFHMASSNIGVEQWWRLYAAMLGWCRSIEGLSGRDVECLDLGGGWFPDDWHIGPDHRFARAVGEVPKRLTHVREIISEPGKAMAQPTMALGMRLLEFERRKGEISEAVVDASIAELPMHHYQPHRIIHQHGRTGEWRPLNRGKTQLLGRLCMEDDILARNVALPDDAQVGDVLVFCDAGGYDRSMSYVFGRG